MNHLEELVAQWFAYCGYFVRRNVLVGKRARGGYECELDVIAYHPGQQRLVHVEPSLDADSWSERERRFAKKFAAGRAHIPALFEGVNAPTEIHQIALLVFANTNGKTLGGGVVAHASQLYREILWELRGRRVESQAVPEQFPLIRTIQQCFQYCGADSAVLESTGDEVMFASPARAAVPTGRT